MTSDIQWGDPIEVDGVRPEWLRDSDLYRPIASVGNSYFEARSELARNIGHLPWEDTQAIRLSDDHPYYTVQRFNAEYGTNFTYWPGGVKAPADWDYGDVLLCNCVICPGNRVNYWRSNAADYDVIGYTKRSDAHEQSDEAEYVRVKRMTEAEVEEMHAEWDDLPCEGDGDHDRVMHWFAKRLGVLRSDTIADRYAAETGNAVTPEIAAALEWAAKHGEKNDDR